MKDVKLHTTDRGNLISIGDLAESYGDQKYLMSLIRHLGSLTGGRMYFELSRPNYDVSNHVNELTKLLIVRDLSVGQEYSEVSFNCHEDEFKEELITILSKLWFAFEHVAYIFSVELDAISTIRRKPWYEITSMLNAYVMFKGVEENIIWIGKTETLQFDLDSLRG